MDDNPYQASSVPAVTAGPSRTPDLAIALMCGAGALIGTALACATLWMLLWHDMNRLLAAGGLGNAAIYAALAYGCHRRSRICACLLLVHAELQVLLVMKAFPPLPGYALLVPVILLLILVRGTMAVFRSHRHG